MHILFVCTGNIFRSLTAEFALRRALGPGTAVRVSSAGTEDFPHVVKPMVRDYLLEKGFDVSAHRRRTLDATILAAADVVIAMSTDHQQFVLSRYGRAIAVFTEACGLAPAPLYDVDEAVADFERNPAAAQAHARHIIDRVIELTPWLADRIMRGELTGT